MLQKLVTHCIKDIFECVLKKRETEGVGGIKFCLGKGTKLSSQLFEECDVVRMQ
jgi:hypothetical protein